MKRVTVTERTTYLIDEDDLLVRLAHGLDGDGWMLGDFAKGGYAKGNYEVVLVEIEELPSNEQNPTDKGNEDGSTSNRERFSEGEWRAYWRGFNAACAAERKGYDK